MSRELNELENEYEQFMRQLRGAVLERSKELEGKFKKAEANKSNAFFKLNDAQISQKRAKDRFEKNEANLLVKEAQREFDSAEIDVSNAKENKTRIDELSTRLANVTSFCGCGRTDNEGAVSFNRGIVDSALSDLSVCMDEKSFGQLLKNVNEPISKQAEERKDVIFANKKGNFIGDIESKIDGTLKAQKFEFKVNRDNGTYNEYSGSFDNILSKMLSTASSIISTRFATFDIKKAEDVQFELSDSAKGALKVIEERAKLKDEKGMTLKPKQVNVTKIEAALLQKEILEKQKHSLSKLKTELEFAQKHTHLQDFVNAKGKKLTSQLDYSKTIADLDKQITKTQKDLTNANKVLAELGITISFDERGVVEYGGLIKQAQIDIDTHNIYAKKDVKIFDKEVADKYMNKFLKAQSNKISEEEKAALLNDLEKMAQENGFTPEDIKTLEKQAFDNQIEPEAYSLVEAWYATRTGKSFETWCMEDRGLTQLPKGWKRVADEISKGKSEYYRQQAEKAEKEKDVVTPEAYEIYAQYQKSRTGKSFETWCMEDRGLTELPKGWKKVAEEVAQGMSEYYNQQAEASQKDNDDYMGM